MASKDDVLEVEGEVLEALPNANFKVKITGDMLTGAILTARIAGKLRKNFIWVMPGDKVKVEVSLYDLTKGRITWRSK